MIRQLCLVLALLLPAVVVGQTRPEPLTIRNALLEAKWESAAGRFSLTERASRRTFLKDGQIPGEGGAANVLAVADKTFGDGEAIVVTRPDGNRATVALFPNLPFALIRLSLHNGGAGATVIKQAQAFSGAVDLGQPVADLVTLGTGGLLAPDKNPGSYVWLAVAEPRSGLGVVGGWLTHERGSGVVFSKVKEGQVWLEGRIDYGRLSLEPGQTEALETFAVGCFNDARLGLESWAETVAKVHAIKLRPQPAGYCTWYSQPHGGASDAQHLQELAIFAATNLAPFGFSVVQIDDGWQEGVKTNGPRRNFTTHRPNGPYPDGMQASANQIKSLGLTPGIWFMPFAGTSCDPFFKDHQDWFVKREDGAPYETAWGGTCLDMTQPGAQDYLRSNVRRIGQEWGYRYFKMDGLWTGTGTKQIYVNNGYREDGIGDAVFHNPKKTNLEAYRDGLRLVREAAGQDVFFLGCCAPQNMRSYGAAMGLVDAMRIGPDNGSGWRSLRTGPTYGSRQYFLHGRVWYNDPDPLYVRAGVPLNQAQLICSWVALSGQMNLSSEWLPGLPPERLDLLKRTLPGHGLLPRPVDLFDEPVPRLWLLSDDRHTPRRDVLGLFNWSDQDQTFDTSLERIGLAVDREYVAFDFWGNRFLPSIKSKLNVSVPKQSCVVLALRPARNEPQVLSTSRHVTQGIVDVLEEKWHEQNNTLSGRSRVVGGDPCELRVSALRTGKSWQVDRVEVSPEDQAAGVRANSKQQNGQVRVAITSAVSREVVWHIRFRAAD